jgi:hypothetical protein
VLAEAGAALVRAHGDQAAHAAADQLPARLAALDDATTRQPFGDPGAVQAAAGDAAAAARELAQAAAALHFDAAATRELALFLTNPANVETRDVATARQTAWALGSLAADLRVAESDRLFARQAGDPLMLALPSGTERSVLAHLPAWLAAAERYDPAWFQAELAAVRRMLGAAPAAP